MRRLVKMRDPLVYPVHCDRILNQVVRSDAKKINFARQAVRRDRGTWDLNHRADLGLAIEGLTFALKLTFAFFEHRKGTT